MAAVLQQGGETSDSISISKSKDYCRGIRTTTSTNNQGAVFLLSSHSIIALHCPAHWPLSHIAPPCPFQSFQFSLASLTILSRSLLFGWLLRRLCGLQSIPSHRHAPLSFSWLSLSWRLSPPPHQASASHHLSQPSLGPVTGCNVALHHCGNHLLSLLPHNR